MSVEVSREAREIFAASDVIDLHVDSFIWTRIFRYDLTKRHGPGLFNGRLYSSVDIPRAVEGGLTGATWVITTNPARPSSSRAKQFGRNLRRLRRILDQDLRTVVVRNAAEYRAARAEGKHGAFIGIQGGNALDASGDSLDLIPDDVILRITLVHLLNSTLGATSAPTARGAQGLSPQGRHYVEQLNSRKVFVDLAHVNRQGFFDALAVHDQSQPLLVTHTGIAACHDHWRNLDDEQIRAVADTGGTIGVMFQSSFLGDPVLGGRAASVVDHIAHIVELVGEDHASIGSDWDGMICPPRDLTEPAALPVLVQLMLDRGWSTERIQKILGGNFLRAVAELRG